MSNELLVVNSELAVATKSDKRNRYTRKADPQLQADIEESPKDAPGDHLNDEIELLQAILVQKMAGATREKMADPEFCNSTQALAKTIGQLSDIRNRIQTSEQFVFTQAAAKKFVANMRESVRLSIEDGVREATANIYGTGSSPSVDIAQTGAAIWQAYRRRMEQMGEDQRAAAVPTMLSTD